MGKVNCKKILMMISIKMSSSLQGLIGSYFFLAKKNYKIIFECHQYSKVRNFVFNKVSSRDNVKIIFLNDFIRKEFSEVDTNNILLPSGVDLEIFDTPEGDMRVSKKFPLLETY